jgi:hypothetical protein
MIASVETRWGIRYTNPAAGEQQFASPEEAERDFTNRCVAVGLCPVCGTAMVDAPTANPWASFRRCPQPKCGFERVVEHRQVVRDVLAAHGIRLESASLEEQMERLADAYGFGHRSGIFGTPT